MDPDPNPPIFVTDLQDATRKQISFYSFSLITFEGTLKFFFKDRKKSQNSRNQGFPRYFCLIKGSGLDPDSIRLVDPDPYSESGSRWAKMTRKVEN
jgi:hypothetical protein